MSVLERSDGALARSHRIVRLDDQDAGRTGDVPGAPYTVETRADDVLAVFDEAGETSAHVVGAPTGGLIAQELAPTSPTRGRSLVLACTHPGAAHAVRDPEPVALLPARGGLTPGQAAEASMPFDDAATTPRERVEEDWAVRLPLACASQGYLAQPMGNSSWPGLEPQPSPSVPTLVVHGEADRLGALDQRRMAEAVPGVELVGLQDADHLPFTDRRERTGDLPRNLLACHRDRPGA